ncbi:hypothetical protein AAY473_024055 [Plecturocebus cupreus]
MDIGHVEFGSNFRKTAKAKTGSNLPPKLEYSGVITAHSSLLRSRDPPTSAS